MTDAVRKWVKIRRANFRRGHALSFDEQEAVLRLVGAANEVARRDWSGRALKREVLRRERAVIKEQARKEISG